MTRTRLGIIALLTTVAFGAVASSPTCDRIYALHATGLDAATIVATLTGDGVAEADVLVAQCLAALNPMAQLVSVDEELDDTEAEQFMPIGAIAAPAATRGARSSQATGMLGANTAPAAANRSTSAARTVQQRPAPPIYDREQNTEHYTDYGVNTLTLTTDDALSTFAVDVDTASYTLARSKLESGVLPDIGAVRVEEFVNYVPYDYPAPSSSSRAPFAVHMEAAPSPFAANHHILRVGVKGKESAPDRRPAHLTFLVDTSCSMMDANKLPLAQEALHTLVDNLGLEDTVALATYAGSTRKVLDPTPITRKDAIHGAINELSASGGTAMSSGMSLAYDMADAAFLPGGINRVIVLSDGDANIGATTHDQILSNIRHHADRGITMTTIGLGSGNYQDTMMEQLANKGDGNYYFIDSMQEANRVFGTHVGGTLDVIARDVKLQVAFDPDVVRAYRLLGYENRDVADHDFRNDAVDAGEIGAEHAVTALYEVVLRDDAPGESLARVHVRAKKPGPDGPAREWVTDLKSASLQRSCDAASDDFRVAFAAATFAEILRASPYVEELRYADVAALLQSTDRGYEADQELRHLVLTAGRLAGENMQTAMR
jgi:Ca-activated chloride channel family protein